MAIQVPAIRATIDRINAAAADASAEWTNPWLPDARRIAAYARWQAAEELGRYLFSPVSIFRTVPCADCGAPARTVCTLTPIRERNPYWSQRPLCERCEKYIGR